MKKVLIGILTGVLLVSSPVSAKEEIEQLYAQSAVLMDADNGRVLFEKNGSEKKPMASTTKIMTCILALEEGNLTDVVNVSENAARQPKVHLGMQMDEKFYLRDLLYSLMLESHNDSAVAIAEHIGGSVQAFADKMNAKAKELGMTNTNFVNASGLHDENHYSTVQDILVLLEYALKNETFYQVFTTRSYTTAPTQEYPEGITFESTMYEKKDSLEVTDGEILGGKTGFTSAAGLCLASLAEVEGQEYILVTAGAEGNHDTEPFHILDAENIYSQIGAAIVGE